MDAIRVRRWYAEMQMNTRMAWLFLLSGLFATTSTAPAQTAPPLPASATQEKTVRFDGTSTAKLILQARGEGVQIYTCVQATDWSWKLKAPDATLFDARHQAIGKHFGGPTWRLDDGSEVQGKVLESKQQAGTIPWLILSAKPTGGEGVLSHVDAVRRTETDGGLAPSTGCDAQHAGVEVRVPYSAAYSFFDTKN
jgi:hypothetical protein